MIRVFECGRPVFTTFRCIICDCVYEADKDDYFVRAYTSGDKVVAAHYTCNCPNCGLENETIVR